MSWLRALTRVYRDIRAASVAGENSARTGPPRTGLRPWGGDEAEPEGCGGPTVEGGNEVWPDFRRNPKGRGHLSTFLRPWSFADTRYASLLIPRTAKKWLPSLATCICRYTLERIQARPHRPQLNPFFAHQILRQQTAANSSHVYPKLG